jgi:hypothetical protein
MRRRLYVWCFARARNRALRRAGAFALLALAAWLGCMPEPNDPPTLPIDATRDAGSALDASVAAVTDAAAPAPREGGPAELDAATSMADAAPIPADATLDAGAAALAKFSFFVTSWRALRELSQHPDGFGGDLRFGETGEGAGLRGADKICSTIAERSLAGAGTKRWRAFLSATTGGAQGGPVHAIERIGEGPWFDRLGRLVAKSRADLMQDRPAGAHPAIIDDLPNENGVPNHDPDGTGPVDNHDTLTGSDAKGMLYDPNPGSLATTGRARTAPRAAARRPLVDQERAGHRQQLPEWSQLDLVTQRARLRARCAAAGAGCARSHGRGGGLDQRLRGHLLLRPGAMTPREPSA